MLNLGTVRPGSTIDIPVNTFDSNDPSASVTATTWANTDCHVHKNAGTTQRASSAGETLTIDFDTVTGNHMLTIDLSDNTTAGFYTAGARYAVRIEGVTVDGATINAWVATWRIGYPEAIIDTTVTVGSQTSITLADGPAEASALVGCPIILHDAASAVQVAHSVITAYAATTKVATIIAPTFTIATGDNVSVFMPSNARWAGSVAWGSGAITAGSIASNAISSSKIATDAITAAKIAADAIGASELAADAATEIAAAVWDKTQSSHTTSGTFGEIATEIASVLVDTAEIGTAGAGLTDLGGMSTAMKAEVNAEMVDVIDTDTYAEPGQAAPGATISLSDKISYLYKAWRNRSTQTSTTYSLYNDDATTVDQKATVSDNGTTADKGEVGTGP